MPYNTKTMMRTVFSRTPPRFDRAVECATSWWKDAAGGILDPIALAMAALPHLKMSNTAFSRILNV
jgi:hypothetical protein